MRKKKIFTMAILVLGVASFAYSLYAFVSRMPRVRDLSLNVIIDMMRSIASDVTGLAFMAIAIFIIYAIFKEKNIPLKPLYTVVAILQIPRILDSPLLFTMLFRGYGHIGNNLTNALFCLFGMLEVATILAFLLLHIFNARPILKMIAVCLYPLVFIMFWIISIINLMQFPNFEFKGIIVNLLRGAIAMIWLTGFMLISKNQTDPPKSEPEKPLQQDSEISKATSSGLNKIWFVPAVVNVVGIIALILLIGFFTRGNGDLGVLLFFIGALWLYMIFAMPGFSVWYAIFSYKRTGLKYKPSLISAATLTLMSWPIVSMGTAGFNIFKGIAQETLFFAFLFSVSAVAAILYEYIKEFRQIKGSEKLARKN